MLNEIVADEEKKKTNPIQSNNAVSVKKKETSNVFEKLEFPAGMTYGHRSQVRKECSRFLRFAYLVDFLALESLSMIYTKSIEVMLERLQDLLDLTDMEKVMTMEFDETNAGGTAPRGQEPLFYVSVRLSDTVAIQDKDVIEENLDDFIPPPKGTSEDQDFDLLSHLQLEEVREDNDDEGEGEGDNEAIFVQLKKKTVPDIHRFWIELTPDAKQFSDVVSKAFQDGLDKIQCFKRWNKHKELAAEAEVLEEWDDMIGGSWEQPEIEFLALDSWITEHPTHKTAKQKVGSLVDSAYNNAQ